MTDLSHETPYADGNILTHLTDGVGVITFNNPDKRNAMSLEMWEGFGEALTALRDVRREMHAAETMVITLADAKRSRGQALATLARVKAAIPDSAVLTAYTWRADGSGLVAGAGRRAADILAAVERSHAVANPRIEGAIVREAIGGRDWERFTIVFGASNP
jgi:hypothetical protein